MRALKSITGHVIYNLAYTEKVYNGILDMEKQTQKYEEQKGCVSIPGAENPSFEQPAKVIYPKYSKCGLSTVQ